MNPTPLTRSLRTVVQVLCAVLVVLAPPGNLADHLGGPALVALLGAVVLVAATVAAAIEKAGPVPVARTLVQVVVALAAIVPAVVAGLAAGGIHLDPAATGTLAALAVLVVTVAQNGLEAGGTIPTLGYGPIVSAGQNDGGADAPWNGYHSADAHVPWTGLPPTTPGCQGNGADRPGQADGSAD